MDFKDHFDQRLAGELAARFKVLHPGFDLALYQAALPADFAPLPMKTRVQALSDALWRALGLSFEQAVDLVRAVLDPIEGTDFGRLQDFPVWVIADLVEHRGLDHPELALSAIHKITRHFTGEFAIRPYLAAYPARTFAQLAAWRSDPSEHVRRLVSEGTRPRLPWATRVPALIDDPSAVIDLLAGLYLDDSEYVRRSVANNLNDISKDHPRLVVDTLADWQANAPQHAGLAWILRHALRSLCKHGDVRALALLGYSAQAVVNIGCFDTAVADVGLGESVQLRLAIHLPKPIAQGLMIDYQLRMPGASGRINKKVFKWSTRHNVPAGDLLLQRSHPIVTTRTRRYYPGEYRATLMVNGQAKAQTRFRVHP